MMDSDKYLIWTCLICQIVRFFLYKADATEFSKVFVTNGKHDTGRCILSQIKKRFIKNFSVGMLQPVDSTTCY